MMENITIIEKILNENHIMGEIVGYNENSVSVEITWGDWKHDHLRFKLSVMKSIQNIKDYDNIITEDDGSDCYSAIHKFYF